MKGVKLCYFSDLWILRALCAGGMNWKERERGGALFHCRYLCCLCIREGMEGFGVSGWFFTYIFILIFGLLVG